MYNYDYRDKESVLSLAKRLNAVGNRLKENGFLFFYHNHNVEFARMDKEKRAYDLIPDNTDSDSVHFEFDSYWPTVSGVNALFIGRRLGKE